MTSIEATFPGLSSAGWIKTSEADKCYNCIAWAAGIDDDWWWPDGFGVYYWPHDVERTLTVHTFVKAFRALGYRECVSADVEPGFEKVALFAVGIEPRHMARQLPDGTWSSKLGPNIDIAANTLKALEGSEYGRVVQVMRRAVGTAR